MHHLLYVMANTHCMNGAMPGSHYTSGVGGMQKADQIRWGITGVAAVGLVVIAGLTVRGILKSRVRH